MECYDCPVDLAANPRRAPGVHVVLFEGQGCDDVRGSTFIVLRALLMFDRYQPGERMSRRSVTSPSCGTAAVRRPRTHEVTQRAKECRVLIAASSVLPRKHTVSSAYRCGFVRLVTPRDVDGDTRPGSVVCARPRSDVRTAMRRASRRNAAPISSARTICAGRARATPTRTAPRCCWCRRCSGTKTPRPPHSTSAPLTQTTTQRLTMCDTNHLHKS